MSENQQQSSSASDQQPPTAKESAPQARQSDPQDVSAADQFATPHIDDPQSDHQQSDPVFPPTGSVSIGDSVSSEESGSMEDEVRIRVDNAVAGPPRRPSDDLRLPPGDLPVAKDAPRKSPLGSGELRGMQRDDDDGRGIIDALAGRASVLGFGSQTVVDAIQLAAEQHLGDACCANSTPAASDPMLDMIRQFLGDAAGVRAEAIRLLPSPDQAVDHAIGLARRSGDENAFQISQTERKVQ